MVRAPLNLEVPNTEKVVVGEAVPIPTVFSFALTTKVLASMLMPVLRVVVAVAEDGIWKIAVPPSVRTLKTFPVNEAPGTSLTKSPLVMVEEEAVSQFCVVIVEEAVVEPVAPMVKMFTPAWV